MFIGLYVSNIQFSSNFSDQPKLSNFFLIFLTNSLAERNCTSLCGSTIIGSWSKYQKLDTKRVFLRM